MSRGPWRAPEPVGVREIENDWIVMPDGVRLAVQLWLPEVRAPAPVVLEYIPYRKRDATRAYSGYWGRRLARNGVAYARLDARGSGDSGGLLVDEYLPREQDDAVHAIAWLAAQPWCNGAVGMRGVSWGGFSTLQAAALAPPALKAIMPMCASDRRYLCDAHYVGGAFALTGLKWATTFKAVMAGPPDEAIFGPDWERAWMQRLEAAPTIAATWLAHQREDDYWRQGSVAFVRIDCPAYVVGGWFDPYTEAIPSLLGSLKGPTKALIGPWVHGYPQPATPGPALDWIAEETRWWRRWLLDEPTGVMEGPRIFVHVAERAAIEVAPNALPGRWIGLDAWPETSTALRLQPGRLGATPAAGAATLASGACVGLQTPEWVPFTASQLPQEQSADDARSVLFDTEPLAEPMELVGTPVARLRLAADAPVAQIAARLNEVTADGRSWPITYGVLNLTHRQSHAEPAPLTPGRSYDIALPLYPAARRLRAGSRLRLALSHGLWPLLWPAPAPATIIIDLEAASLELPTHPGGDGSPLPIAEIEPAPASARDDPEMLRERSAAGEVRFEERCAVSRTTLADTGTTIERCGVNVALSMRADDPASCRWSASHRVGYERGDWGGAVEVEVEITASADAFHVRERLSARRADRTLFDHETDTPIPRDLA